MVLPLEAWQKIFSNLNLQDLRVCMLVCKLWNSATASDRKDCRFLWYQLYQRDFDVLVGNLNFNQETHYKNFYKSLFPLSYQKLLAPLKKKAEANLKKARAADASRNEMDTNYGDAIKSLETALKIQAHQKGDTTALTDVIANLKQELLIPRILQDSPLYLHSKEEIRLLNDIVDLYKEDPFSCWAEYIKVSEEEGLPDHARYLAAALYEHQRDFITAAKHYLELTENHPHPLTCLKKAAAFVQKPSSDQLAYPHFLEKLDRDKLLQLQQTTSDAELDMWILHKDEIRMAFEESLDQLSRSSPQTQAPTCFVCFNLEELDVGKWLEHVLVPDLDRMGIKPLFCFRDLGTGKELNNFQGLIRSADQVIIVCTPGLKKKCDERKKAPTGVAQEIRLAQERYNDPDKYETIFPLYLKGDRKSSCPSVFIEAILGTTFTYLEKSTEASVFSYYSSAFELLGGMRKVPRVKSRQIKEEFLKKVSLVLKGAEDLEKLKRWRERRASKHQQIVQSIQERVSVNTQMVNLPLPPQDFTGREKELEELHEKCSHGHRVAVTGLGGIGKTTLALKYASDYKAHYQFIHFMSAGSSLSLIDGLLKLADDLHVSKSDKVEERLGWLKTTLEKFPKEYLLIFDGIDQIEAFQEVEKYLPARGRCLLLTSRMPQQAKAQNFKVVELHLFSSEEAVEYLLKATGLKESKEAQELAELLGRLPLALKHAAGYIRSRKMTIQDYIKEFQKHQIKLFEDQYLTLTKEEKTILTTWNMSIEAIEKDHNCLLAKEILEFFAFLGQAPIPDSLVEEWGKQFHPDTSELSLENALRYLCDYSMISSPQAHTYEIHSLVQGVMRYQIFDEKQEKIFKKVLTVMTSRMKEFNRDKTETWPALKLDLPHAIAMVENQEKLFQKIALEQSYEFLVSLGKLCHSLGDPQKTLEILKKCLNISEKWAHEHPDDQDAKRALATSYNDIGLVLQALGKLQKALDSYQKGLAIWVFLFGENHPHVATSYNNIGSVFKNLGKPQEALKSLQKARDIRLRLFDKDHPDVATSYNNIGSVLKDLGKPQEALESLQKARDIRLRLFDENHPRIATSYGNIGSVLKDLGKPQEALKSLQKALAIWLSFFGENHQHVATSYANIGSVLKDLGKPQEALKSLQKALAIWLPLFGEKHPHVATNYDNIGGVLQALGKLQEALESHQKALAIRLSLFGENHPDVVSTSHQIRGVLQSLGRPLSELDDYKKTLTAASLVSPSLKNPSRIIAQDPTQKNTNPPSIQRFSLNPSGEPLQWNSSEIALRLWRNSQALISDEMVKKVQFVTDYLQAEGFVLGGIAADGNCFLNAFLESYKTLSRKIPILDEQSHPVHYLRICIAAEYPQDSAQNRVRADQIKKDREWITAQGEGDLLAKGLFIPIRIVTVHQDSNGLGISDMLTLPGKDIFRKEWKTISEQDRPQEYIFIVDVGGHFLYAKKSG